MKINDLERIELTPGFAYIIGLIYPLSKYKIINNIHYRIGAVNHNQISEEELAYHFKNANLIKREINEKFNINIDLRNNQVNHISGKKGFSFLIETNEITSEICEILLLKKVKEISNDVFEVKKEFAKGCFDGRASWDKTAHYFSVDVDRNLEKQEIIKSIFSDLNIELNLNQREKSHPKNDQLRIKPSSIKQFLKYIGLYSQCRINILQNAIDKEII